MLTRFSRWWGRESLGCYRRIADGCPQHLVFEALSLVKGAAREGTIRRSRGALFVDLVKRFCRSRNIPLQLGVPHGGAA